MSLRPDQIISRHVYVDYAQRLWKVLWDDGDGKGIGVIQYEHPERIVRFRYPYEEFCSSMVEDLGEEPPESFALPPYGLKESLGVEGVGNESLGTP